MALQRSNPQFRKAVKGFYAWLGALMFAAVTPFVAVRLLSWHTLSGRIGATILGPIGWLPMIAVVIFIIRAGDEFHQRMHLVACSVALAAALVLLTVLDWLTQADFIEPPSLSVIWISVALLWAASLLLVKWQFERNP